MAEKKLKRKGENQGGKRRDENGVAGCKCEGEKRGQEEEGEEAK